MPNCAKKCFGQRAHGDARRGFARAGAFQNVAGVVKLYLIAPARSAWPGRGRVTGLRLVFRAVDIFHRQRFGPVLPIFVVDDDGDGRADGLRVADAGDNFDAVRFDLHAAAAAVALLAAPQFAIDGVERDGNTGGKSGQGGDQALSMRFTGCFEAKHGLGENFMLAEKPSASGWRLKTPGVHLNSAAGHGRPPNRQSGVPGGIRGPCSERQFSLGHLLLGAHRYLLARTLLGSDAYVTSKARSTS